MPSINGCPRRLILLPAPLRKYTQVTTELQTSCNQVVVKLISGLFPIVVPSLEQVVLILLQGNKLDKFNKVDDGNKLVTSCSNKTARNLWLRVVCNL